ncbi:MAG: hypothetical protein K9M08_09975 [Pirellula sp.]|nr:hypothetical protein [Pirellula sp.]
MSPKKSPSNNNAKGWSGLDVPTLNRVEIEFCTLRRRPEIRPRNGEATSQRVGYLVSQIMKFLKEKNPEQQLIASAINQSASHVSVFLSGREKSDAWIERGRQILTFVLTGKTNIDDASEPIHELAKRIDSYFFRSKKGKKPKYFDDERAGSPDAWSYRELASEISLFSRSIQSNGTYEIWYFSGGTRFFSDDDDRIKNAIDECIRRGISLTFVFPKGEAEIRGQLEIFSNERKEIADKFRKIELDRTFPTISTFLTPEARYLLMQDLGPDEESDEDDISNLWIQRPSQTDHEAETFGPSPKAWIGLRRELLAVRRSIVRLKMWENSEDIPHIQSEPNPETNPKSKPKANPEKDDQSESA